MGKKQKRSKKTPKVLQGRSTARGRVWAESYWHPRGTRWTWHYEVTDSLGKVVMEDCFGPYENMLSDAQEAVAAVRLIENQGHVLRYDVDTLFDLIAAR